MIKKCTFPFFLFAKFNLHAASAAAVSSVKAHHRDISLQTSTYFLIYVQDRKT